MKLRKAQKEQLLVWVAEGLETDEINARAAKFKPRFRVTRQQVDYYRKSTAVKLEEIKEAGETSALMTGLAIKTERVEVLQKIADLLIGDLLPADAKETSKLWTNNKKAVGMSTYDFKEFNKAEIDSLRGVLDDIAKELGERAPGVQVNNTYNFNMEEWKKTRSERMKQVQDLEED